MRILIINPNTDHEMSKLIEKNAREFVNNDYYVECRSVSSGPSFIATYEHQVQSAASTLSMIRENEHDFDAFIIACHADPNLDVCKEVTNKVVVGISEASMKLATMLGHNFSVISPVDHSIPNKEALARKYHLDGQLASVTAPSPKDAGLPAELQLLSAAKIAVQRDKAEVLVLGCAGMSGVDKLIQAELGVPVIDGIMAALIIASGLVRYGVSTSKIRRYNPVY